MLSVAQWIVTLLFFCIEILPVLIKVLLNIGPLSNYEELLKNEEDIIADNAKIERVTRRRAAEREADRVEREAVKQEVIDKDMIQLEEALGKKANKHVAQHMEAILDVALADWSRQVQAQTGRPAAARASAGTDGSGQRSSAGTVRTGGTGTPGGPPVHVTAPQPRLSLTGPQPVVGASGTQPPVNGGQSRIWSPWGQRERRQREQRQRPGPEESPT